MLSRLLHRFRSLTVRQRVVIVAVATVPIAMVVAVLVGEVVERPALGSSFALALLAVSIIGAVVYAANHARVMRQAEKVAAEGPAAAVIGAHASRAVRQADPVLVHGSPHAEYLAWLSSFADAPARPLLAHGLMTRSRVARDFFALTATQWRFDEQALRSMLSAPSAPPAALDAIGPCDPAALVSLTRLVLGHAPTADDQQFAAHLRTLALHQNARLSPLTVQYLVQQSLLGGEPERAAALLPMLDRAGYPARFFQLDLVNPHSGFADTLTEDAWISAVGGVFQRSGLEPIALQPSGPSVFDRLTAYAPAVSDTGPLVTVIMSCYEPDESLITAVRSMMAQTWLHWELIITDDASPSDPTAFLDRVASLDTRIRVVRNSHNAGTYVRRNEAIELARGELVTMHDSDDWVHPRRLEIQVRHLQRNPELLANLSQSVRVSENLMFAQPRGASIRLTESSLMFRRHEVTALIGRFDVTRKAADSEFRMRLEAAIGEPIPLIDLEAPLSLVRFDVASLSGSDLGDGWIHPARAAYRGAQAEWRRQRLAAGESLSLDGSGSTRPFPAHRHLTGATPVAIELDVLYVLDGREGTGFDRVVQRAAEEIVELAGRGVRVGVRRADALLSARVAIEAHPVLQALINHGVISEVLCVDEVRATTLVVRDQAALAGIGSLDATVNAEAVVIVDEGRPIPKLVIDRALAIIAPHEPPVRTLSRRQWSAEIAKMTSSTGSTVAS